MLESIRKAVVVPSLNLEIVVGAATVFSFIWLLAHGFIRPIAVYLLELYLTF